MSSNAQLRTLDNFPELETIGGYFSVGSNIELTDLGDFPALTSIGRGEAYVPSLRADRNKVSILVEYNLNLSNCSVLRKFLSTGIYAVTGDIYINETFALN